MPVENVKYSLRAFFFWFFWLGFWFENGAYLKPLFTICALEGEAPAAPGMCLAFGYCNLGTSPARQEPRPPGNISLRTVLDDLFL